VSASIVALVALVAAAGLAFGPAVSGMRETWDATPMYSFGYIVPVIAAFVIWKRRGLLAGASPAPAVVPGALTLAAAAALLAAGRLGGVQVAEQAAFVLALPGVVLVLWGAAVLRTVWFALAYLVLMIPFWEGLTEPLHLPFQQLSANLGIRMLHVVGVPAYREGLYLYLPNVTLEVARACSGVNYLVAILALGAPLGYLYLPTIARRVLLLAVATAVAAISNSLRVALIGVLSYLDIGSPLHGPGHVLHGVFVSGIGYVVLLAGLRVLGTRESAEGPPRPGGGLRRLMPAAPMALGVAGALALTAAFLAIYQPQPVARPLPLAQVPDRLGDWTASGLGGHDAWWHRPDDELRRQYRRDGAGPIDVAVAYYATQRQGRELAGQEAGPLHRAVTDAGVALEDGALVNAIRLETPHGARAGLFWYEVEGRPLTTARAVKIHTTWSAVRHRRSNGSLVVLLAPDRTEARPDDYDHLRELAGALRRALAAGAAGTAATHSPRP
jgi:EpsI family protein